VYLDGRSVKVRDSINDVAVTECTLEVQDRKLKRLLDDASISIVRLN